MKSRRVMLMMEVETSLPISTLRKPVDIVFAGIGDPYVWKEQIHQASVNVIKPKPKKRK